MSAIRTDSPLKTVRLEGLPLRMLAAAQEQVDGLLREFALVTGGGSSDGVPHRLLELAASLRGQYAAYTDDSRRRIDAAAHRRDVAIDVSMQVPADAADAAQRLLTLLDEADAYCRSGDLLTLATPPDLLAFRRWYLGEFVRQISGAPQQRWSGPV
jgi:hypothetical protein